MIQVSDFHKTYGDTVAVRGLTFSVAPGEILGLVGPNGAGKTTTLRALAGIVSPTRGELSCAGHCLQQAPLQAKQELAYVPDDPQLFSDLTVAQHLSFVAAAYNVTDAEAKAAKLLETFSLTEKSNTPAGDLSRGMRQKLAICCAYLYDPQVLLCDEPMTGLDPKGIRALKESIQQRAEQGAAIIISSHLLGVVEDICSHVLILQHGNCQFHGRLAELQQQFEAEATAATLEEMFFLATDRELATSV